jgi:hypothetical protein
LLFHAAVVKGGVQGRLKQVVCMHLTSNHESLRCDMSLCCTCPAATTPDLQGLRSPRWLHQLPGRADSLATSRDQGDMHEARAPANVYEHSNRTVATLLQLCPPPPRLLLPTPDLQSV